MANLVLKITREEQEELNSPYVYKDIDAFSDKYAPEKLDVMLDVEAVKASVRNIFMWNTGEEILYPRFGNNLRKFLYQPLNDSSKSDLAQEIKRCIEENDKRIIIDSLALDTSDDADEYSVIRFRLSYHVVGERINSGIISDTITITGEKGDLSKTAR